MATVPAATGILMLAAAVANNARFGGSAVKVTQIIPCAQRTIGARCGHLPGVLTGTCPREMRATPPTAHDGRTGWPRGGPASRPGYGRRGAEDKP